MSTRQPYKGPISGPCSACGDGDTAMKYHDHSNLRQFPARVGIVINWGHLRDLMKQYLDERGGGDEEVLRQLALSDFLIWVHDQQRRQQRKKVTTK